MKLIKLNDFEIANGFSRIHQVLEDESWTLSQETDEDLALRAAWPTYFPDRAVQRVPLSYVVMWPECEDLAAAALQARVVPFTTPKGGVLIEELDGTRITYAAAKKVSVTVLRIGIRNQFTTVLEAVNPTVQSLVLDELGDILEDEAGDELEY